MGRVDLSVPSVDDVQALSDRLKHFGVPTRDDGKTVAVDDPWGKLIVATAAPA